VKDEELMAIFKMLYSKVEIPSPSTLSQDIVEMFEILKESVKRYLVVSFPDLSAVLIALTEPLSIIKQDIDGKVHVSVDGWTAPQVISFMGITIQFFKAGQLHSFILDFFRYVGDSFTSQALVDSSEQAYRCT